MKNLKKGLLVLTACLSFLNANSQSSSRSLNDYVFNPDSLKGFNETKAWEDAKAFVADPVDYKGYVYNTKRVFINHKYNLQNKAASFKFTPPVLNPLAAPCVNEGFESGNITGWTASRGTNTSSCSYVPTPTSIGLAAPYLAIQSTPFVDPIVGAIPNSPYTGSNVLKLNDGVASGNRDVVRIAQTFPVTSSNFLYEFAYIMVSNSVHGCCDQPFMYVRLRDCIGNLLACPVFSITPPSTGCTGTGASSTWSATPTNTFNPAWQKYSIDLTSYIGSCVSIEVSVGDCSFGGHFGYAYFDSNCNTFGVTLNGSTFIPAPTQTITVQAPCATTATLTAPNVLNPYIWNAPAGSGVTSNTNQTISSAVPGNYTLTMNPFGVCTPIFRIINLQFVPPLTITATPTVVCPGNSSTLIATGATNYTWSTGPTTSSTVVTPGTTTIYTVTANTSTCTTTGTVQVATSLSPTVVISASTPSICSGSAATYTATGATSYTWMPGSITGSVVSFSPSSSTTYTCYGAIGSGCVGSNTVQLTVVASPTVTAGATFTAICNGNSTTLFAGGASTYTWNPGGLSGAVAVVSPTTTTTYTVTGSNGGACTGTSTVTINVSNGPTLTVTSSPTTICSGTGGSSTLTASGAVSYTWNPGPVFSATTVVSPTVTSTYSVTGANAIGCLSTKTIQVTITSTPTLALSASSSTICSGTSTSLTASGATTYTWNPGGLTGANVTVSPATNTTYTVIGANGPCTDTETISITVLPSPTVAASSTPTSICVGSSATLTASGAITYTWNPGALTGSTTVVTPTTTVVYSVTGTAANGCTNTQTVNLTVLPLPTVTAVSSSTAICIGSSATLTAGGATTYTWNPGGLTGANVTVSPTVTTVYTVTGSNGTCSNTKTISLTVNPTPTVTASVSPTVICAGNSATLTGSGATSYTWNPGALTGANVTVNPASTTIYTVTGSNGTCSSTGTVSLLVNPNPTLTASSSPTAICSGSGTTVTLTAIGAATYTWNPGALSGASATVSPAATTSYTVTGTNAFGCTSTTTVNVIVNTTPTVGVSASSSTICSGNSTTLTATGATTYSWNPGALTGANVTVSPTSTTIYTVTGANGNCTNSQTISITVNTTPTVTAAANPTAICSGNSSTLTASGATSYTWNPGALTSGTVTVSPSTTNTYTVIGATGSCTDTKTVTINVTTTPTVVVSASNSTICSGNSSTLTASGATTYTWNPGALTGTNVTVSPASTTTYTLTGANGSCTDSKTITITVISSPTVTAAASPTAICSGQTSTLTANGATTYTWNPGALTGSSVAVSPSSNTTYTITGSNGACATTATLNLTVTTTPTITASASPNSICAGASVTLSASGATTYTWNPGAITTASTVVTPTATTIYTITGNSGSCSNTQTVSLTVNPNPTVNATASPTAICAGQNATLSASGATSYTWNPGSLTGTNISVSPAATTIYTVTGVTGSCTNTKTVSLTVNALPTIAATVSPVGICVGSSATLTAAGALSYTWNPGSLIGANAVVNPTTTTTYTVTGSNAAGCTNTAVATLSVNPTPTVIANASPSSICTGNSTTLTATGATSYTWNPGALTGSNVVISPTVNTTYTVIGSNSGCTSTQTIAITVNGSPTITASASPANICSGQTATLSGTGATSYTWNPGALSGSSATVNPTSTTTYTLIGSNGLCTSTTTVNLTVTPNPTVSAISTPTAICTGASATLSASGATSYTWNPGAISGSTTVVTPTATTIYSVTGNNGTCSNTQTISLTVIPNPTLTISATSSSICAGQTATLTANGATTYTWNPGVLTGSFAIVSPTATAIYTVTGTNGSCSTSQTISLVVNPNPTITATASPGSICAGGSSTLTASGGLTYTWQPGASNSNPYVVTPGASTTYSVRGDNAFGCASTTTVNLTVNSNPTVVATASPASICSGTSTTLTAIGATSYTWNPGTLTGSNVVVSPTTTTTYSVIGDNSGCTSTQTVTVTVFTGPTILATASKTNICIGDTVTLTGSGASTYTWNPGNITSNPIIVTPTATTIYTVTGSNGICSSTATISITANPTPTLFATSNPTAICVGSSATLTAFGATNYTWTPGGSTSSTIVVSPTVTTTYTVTGANSICLSTKTLTLTVSPNPTITVTSPTTTICRFSTTTLTANGASSYTWMPGSLTGSAVAVSPTVTTVYTVTGTSAAGCSATRTYTINVLIGPNFNAVSNPTTICSGSSATLIAFAFGPPLSYTWSPIGTVSNTVVVSPSVTTVYSVTAANGAGCTTTRTVNLVVNTTPTVVASASSSTICSGTSATLTATGATNYTWTPGPITGSTAVVSPTTSTTYTVRGANGNCSNTQTISITVISSPTITASATPTILCSGSSATLSAAGATSFTWNPGAITGNTTVVTPTVATVYTVTGTNGGICASTRTVLINVNTPTISTVSSPTSICVGASATLTASGANTYTWNPGALSGTNIVVSPTTTTTYTVSGTNTFGCNGTSTITLAVLNLPTVTVVSSPTAVCAGNSATLSSTGASSYTWNPGALTGNTVVVTPTATTIYTVTGNNGACTATSAYTLNVNSLPTVSVASTPTALCSGASATLTGSGAVTYSWMPGSLTGTSAVVSPTSTTVYTVTGSDALGCTNTGTVSLTVNTPTISATATPTSICVVGTVTLSANGASTYTWMPGSLSGSTTIVNPTVTTTYTVSGTNSFGCTSNAVLTVSVLTTPTISAAASSSTLCSGYTATLTSTGAISYTWMPGSLNGSTVTVTPTTTTTYTVYGANGGCALDTAFVTINVSASPAGVTASSTGTINCLSSTANLFGASTSTNVGYFWSGPSSYTSATQNPTGITAGGVYTLSVIDLTSGCITTATTSVATVTAGPTVTLTSTGTITCLSNTVAISITSTVSGVTYTWTGPSSFTSNATSFTVSTGGWYYVSAFDAASGCTRLDSVAVTTDTFVPVTATITPATCTGSVTNNDGTITLGNFIISDKYDFVAGATYTGTATYATASTVPVSGVITNTLANPSANTPYTVRIFGVNGCFKDTTLILVPIDCGVNNALGVAKSVSTPTLNTNGSYDVVYKVVIKNTGFAQLNNVLLTENLNATFPLPTTFSVISAPVITSSGSSLSINATFDGNVQTNLTNTLTSVLPIGQADTIVFAANIKPNGIFGPFNNTVIGAATGGTTSVIVADSSQVGNDPDPDFDGDPTNNNIPTPLSLNPNLFFGLTKEGSLNGPLPDNSYDVTYTITVHNLGNDTLRNVVVKDSLFGTTIKNPATYTMKSGPFVSGTNLTANISFNGNSDANLLIPASSKMPPNTTNAIVFTINVIPDTVTVISNSAIGNALSSASVLVSDTSNAGSNPDSNSNGIWNEPADNKPTVLKIESSELFVPEGFSPDGDNKNDFFVIKGLNGKSCNLTVYNRWGNKVYSKDNYDNSWNGTPNVNGTLGSQKLPQGTYYYILEFTNSDLKTMNGYVILQY